MSRTPPTSPSAARNGAPPSQIPVRGRSPQKTTPSLKAAVKAASPPEPQPSNQVRLQEVISRAVKEDNYATVPNIVFDSLKELADDHMAKVVNGCLLFVFRRPSLQWLVDLRPANGDASSVRCVALDGCEWEELQKQKSPICMLHYRSLWILLATIMKKVDLRVMTLTGQLQIKGSVSLVGAAQPLFQQLEQRLKGTHAEAVAVMPYDMLAAQRKVDITLSLEDMQQLKSWLDMQHTNMLQNIDNISSSSSQKEMALQKSMQQLATDVQEGQVNLSQRVAALQGESASKQELAHVEQDVEFKCQALQTKVKKVEATADQFTQDMQQKQSVMDHLMTKLQTGMEDKLCKLQQETADVAKLKKLETSVESQQAAIESRMEQLEKSLESRLQQLNTIQTQQQKLIEQVQELRANASILPVHKSSKMILAVAATITVSLVAVKIAFKPK